MKSNMAQLKEAEKHLGQSCPTCCSMRNNCCCYFVCDMFRDAGNASLFYDGKMVTYCPNAIKWCKSKLAQIPIFLALPMDVAFFDWNHNNVPDHIGFVDHRISDEKVATLEANTTTRFVVARQVRPNKYVLGVFRPHYKVDKSEYDATKKLAVDGQFGYNSIAVMQKWLGVKVDAILGKDTVKALQKRIGVTADGSWGENTSRAVQKLIGTTVDGAFGEKSVKALQRYLNKVMFSEPKKEEPKKETVKKNSLTHRIGQACLKVAKLMRHAKYHWRSHPNEENCQEEGTCVTFVAVVLQILGYLEPGQYIWHDGRGYGDGKVYGTNKWMEVIYMHNKKLKKLKKKLKAGDILLFDDNKSGERGSGGHILILSNSWKGNDPYVWDNASAKNGKKHTYSGERKVLAVVRLKDKKK